MLTFLAILLLELIHRACAAKGKKKKKRNRARRGSLDPPDGQLSMEEDLPAEEEEETLPRPEPADEPPPPAIPECVICTDAVADHVLVPCGHKCVCPDCAELLNIQSQPCPICRAEIRSAIKVYEA